MGVSAHAQRRFLVCFSSALLARRCIWSFVATRVPSRSPIAARSPCPLTRRDLVSSLLAGSFLSAPELSWSEESKPDRYGDGPAYWDARYTKDPTPIEWLADWRNLQEAINEATGGRQYADILHVGCGNSVLPEEMYDAGFRKITNVDISSVVVKQMMARNQQIRPGLQWRVVDITRMPEFADQSFDAVLDKSVIDTMACDVNASQMIDAYLREALRVLRPGGAYLCVSLAPRLEYFRPFSLTFSVKTLEIRPSWKGGSTPYAYLLRKLAVDRG